MDLYGDLPPTSTATGGGSTNPIIGESWSSLTRKLDCEAKTNKVTVESKSTSAVAAPSVKFVPSTLLFKPRQTSVTSSSSAVVQQTSSLRTEKQRASDLDPAIRNEAPIPATSTTAENNKQLSLVNSTDPARVHSPPLNVAIVFNTHSSFEIDDHYDPRRPNDYLQFCDERTENRRRLQLAEDNRRRLEEADQARAELERERKDAAERGDYQRLLSSSLTDSGGRGRGRGMNLPAWMVEKMKQDDALPASQFAGQFADAKENDISTKRHKSSHPSRVLLLENMVGIKEVDDSLCAETQSECAKYGPVRTCEILVLDWQRFPRYQENNRVRIFVEFERQDSAVRACKDLNGRFFGGREIQATFFDENKFRTKHLEPDDKS